GTKTDFALAGFRRSGVLDTTFGTGGTVTTSFGSRSDFLYAVAIQSDGKIVAAGFAEQAAVSFALARYRASGALDGRFGTRGKVTTAIGSVAVATAVAIQSDGKIVAAGYAAPAGDAAAPTNDDFAVARYEAA